MVTVQPGEVGISTVTLITDLPNYKVWEVALATLHPDVLTIRGDSVYLKAGVRTTLVDVNRRGAVTVVSLGLGERWHVIADGGRDSLRIVAYVIPPRNRPVTVWSRAVLQYGDADPLQQRAAL